LKKNPEYGEGYWFAVPLGTGGFSVGIIARMNKRRNIILGYFFAERWTYPPRLVDIQNRSAEEAVLKCIFNSRALVDARWPILGRSPGWDRGAWPMPAFCRTEELTGRYWKVIYPDDDPTEARTEIQITADECQKLPKDVLFSPNSIEATLTRLLESEGATMRTPRNSPDTDPAADSSDSPMLATYENMASSDLSDCHDPPHAVLVCLRLSDDSFGDAADRQQIEDLEDRIARAVDREGVGEFDGNEIGRGFWQILVFGPSADRILETIEPILKDFPARPGSFVIKRYGEPEAREVRVEIWPSSRDSSRVSQAS